MKRYMQRAEELKESVTGNYEHSTDIQDYELVEWLIEQAKKVDQLEKYIAVKDESLNSIRKISLGLNFKINQLSINALKINGKA